MVPCYILLISYQHIKASIKEQKRSIEKQVGFHQATLGYGGPLYGTTQKEIMIGRLEMWILLELTLGVYHPLEIKGYQVVHIMFQMMHGSMLEMVVGSLQMPMMSA